VLVWRQFALRRVVTQDHDSTELRRLRINEGNEFWSKKTVSRKARTLSIWTIRKRSPNVLTFSSVSASI